MLSRVLLVFFLVSCSAAVVAQVDTAQLHQLQNKLLKSPDGSIPKYNAYRDLAELTITTDLDRSIQVLDQGLQDATRFDNIEWVADLKMVKAKAYSIHSRWVQSNEILEECIEIYKQLGDELKQAICLNLLGDNLYRLGQISSSLKDTEIALEIAQRLGDRSIEAKSLLGIGRIYKRQKNYDKSLEFLRANLHIYKDQPNSKDRAEALNSIGDVNMTMGNYQAAIDTLRLALNINNKIDAKTQATYNYVTLGETYNLMNIKDSAVFYLEKALDLTKTINNLFITSYIHSTLGQVYLKDAQIATSLRYLYQAYDESTEVGSEEVINKTLKTLHEAYAVKGNYDSAYKYLKEYQFNLETNIERENRKTQRLLKKLDSQMRKAREDAMASELIREKNQIASLTVIIIIGGASLIGLLIFGIVIYRQNQRRKSDNEELNRKNEEINKQNQSIAQQTLNLEKALENLILLNKVSRKIIVDLSVDEIVEIVNQNVAAIFKNDVFGIGILNEEKNGIEFKKFIEYGTIEDYALYDFDDKDNLSVLCFDRNEEIIIDEYTVEYKKYVSIPKNPKIGGISESVIYMPLTTKNGVIGVVTLQNKEPNSYDAYSINMIRNLSNFISIAIENAHAYENIRNREQEIQEQKDVIEDKNALLIEQNRQVEESYENIKLLNTLGTKIAAHLSVVDIIRTVYESINSLINAELFSIGIYDEEKNSIYMPNTIEKGKVLPPHSYDVNDENRMAVVCFKNVEEIMINDLRKEYRKYLPNAGTLSADVGDIPESLIYLPLVGRSKILGTLSVQSFQKNSYSENDLNLLRNLAIYITVALENAETYDRIKEINSEIEVQKAKIEESNTELEVKNREVEDAYKNVRLLADVGKGIVTKLSVPSIISTVYKSVNTLMDANIFWIGIYDKKSDHLFFEGAFEHGKSLEPFSIPLSDDERLAAYCFNRQKEINIQHFTLEYKRYFDNLKPAVAGHHSESIIYIPLTTINKRVGVLTIQSFKQNAYSDYHINIIRNLAVYTVIALENALLYKNLEGEVADRTAQIIAQKQEIERQKDIVESSFKNIQLLSDIGQKITRTLSVENIIETVYENVNNLMDANAFGLGILRPEIDGVEFIGAMEGGEALPRFVHSLKDKTRYSIWCIEHRQEVILNNATEEYTKYIKNRSKPVEGEDPNSLIYLPLLYQDRPVGCITVQSMEKDAYDDYHVEILRTLSVYAAIALENAKAYFEIEEKSREIAKNTQKIRSSINYARRIQRAILPAKSDLDISLPDSFIMFKPRDVVSGDFYWFLERDHKVFLAAVDCTGHGVPGAIMSMIGSVLLGEIINLMGYQEPDLILNKLHIEIRDALKQENTNNRDGMDISLCVIDKQNRTVSFAGAKQSLVYVSHDQDGNPILETIKGDKAPIGGIQRERERVFMKHVIQLPPAVADGDTKYQNYTNFYLFSDGYQDQFGIPPEGGPSRKYMLKNMKEDFLRMHKIPMVEQQKEMEETLRNWQQSEPQIDDVLVVGFRI